MKIYWEREEELYLLWLSATYPHSTTKPISTKKYIYLPFSAAAQM